MQRSALAYLADVVEACDAIQDVLSGVDLDAYMKSRAIRSSVEREFITIGEAVGTIGRTDPALFEEITDARMIVGLRNLLTHDYAAIDDESVYGVAELDLPVLRGECAILLKRMGAAD